VSESKRKHFNLLRGQLENEVASFRPHWRELSDYIFPRRSRFFTADVNRGDRRSRNIKDITPTLAARTLRSGMMSGITSPARPWFRLTTPDPELAEFGSVKEWLNIVGQRMSNGFLRSNLYNMLPTTYGDIGVFGTSALLIEEDFNNLIHTYQFPIGSYMIGNDSRLKVNTFFREFRMSVSQLVEKFGRTTETGAPDWSKFSTQVKSLWDSGQTQQWIDVCHVIEPNPDYDPKKHAAKFKKFRSVYYESGTAAGSQTSYMNPDNEDRYLSESGYDYFPVLCPRWEVVGEDIYGTNCPGMESLGDNMQLQLGEKRALQALEKMINPPMTAPTSLRNSKASILPSDITYVDTREGQQGFRPAHEVNFRLEALESKQAQVRNRINEAFFVNLFLMLANSDRRQITAREIEERHEEKLLALGPVLEQLNQDLLDPLIDNTFEIMVRQGLVPEPPQELAGMKLKVEYISVMAQAQKLVGIAGIERFAGFAANVASSNPEILDKIDTDQLIDVYADLTSIPPGIVRTDEDVEALRASRAKAQQAQAMSEMVQKSAGAARDLSQADMSGDNALTRLLQQGQAGQLVPQ